MTSFPRVFERLPEADVPFQSVHVRLLQGPTASAMFLEALRDTDVPEHAHGDQWGIVVDGEMRLTVAGKARTCRKGDEYFISAGTPHAAVLKAGVRVIDFFDDPNRYRPRA